MRIRGRGGLDGRRSGGVVLDAATWCMVGVPALACATVVVGISSTPTMAAAQGLLPMALPLGVAAMVVAAVRRRERQVLGAGLVVLVAAALVAPEVTARERPDWATRSDRFVVVASNLWRHNPDPGRAFAVLARSGADVVVLSEWQARFAPALDRSPLGRMTRVPIDGVRGDTLLLARLPVTASGLVAVGSATVRVVPVHTSAPYTMRYMGRWRDELSRIGRALQRTSASTDNLLVVGDFNASVWNPPFRDLLDAGLIDAHAATGRGLARTWGPRQAGSPPVLGIDHALSRGDLFPLRTSEVRVPGSDHRAIRVVYAIR